VSVCFSCLLCTCQAVETLKSFEKKDSKVAAAAATNLSFLYNLVCTCHAAVITSIALFSVLRYSVTVGGAKQGLGDEKVKRKQ